MLLSWVEGIHLISLKPLKTQRMKSETHDVPEQFTFWIHKVSTQL